MTKDQFETMMQEAVTFGRAYMKLQVRQTEALEVIVEAINRIDVEKQYGEEVENESGETAPY